MDCKVYTLYKTVDEELSGVQSVPEAFQEDDCMYLDPERRFYAIKRSCTTQKERIVLLAKFLLVFLTGVFGVYVGVSTEAMPRKTRFVLQNT